MNIDKNENTRNERGRILKNESQIRNRWRDYFESIMKENCEKEENVNMIGLGGL